MDIKQKITEIVNEVAEKLKTDDNLLDNFKKEPVKTLESLIGKDLPDEQIEKVIDLIKAKLSSEKLADKTDDVKGMLKGIGKLFS